ncbi:NAD(P)-dependent oxidoreductase [Mediterraneibacter gnavus]|uniref:NAD(P)-dependent oxidoreductase n=1 Tax=Mediterraneibacter gnavus TaxID=33038 RepID=UPI00232B278B|nr:NAD(P)-dependent oxidoreductase [Mediterraneibacter gnavus]MDB8710549.1 NAD(P)-dependent oxidoreductase [Mediterraneibacter gnavus]MDB8713985.1 NAD(P)-dependent oxidoreductase [Mediterraneibacter gnavus]
MGLHVIDEAKRCLNCKKPRCQEGCPIHTPIPVMIQMLLQGQMPEAAEMVFANNPLSVICSLVCDHEKQCEGHCVKGIKGEPVHISSIENYISDTCFDRMKLEQLPKNGKRIAVVGAGPAGITIAILMACRGYKVTIFEVKEKIGGIMRYGIPEFRLPKSILDRYYVKMKELGILFRPNFALGGSTGVEDLLRDGYHAVFIGTGTWRPYQLHIPGETFGNVHYGINYLNNPDVYDLGDRVLVIGAGNAAMDVARTAIRKGSRHVTVYSITEVPAASPKEVEYAKLDGVEFEYLQTAIEIRDEGAMICDVEWTEDGKLVKKEETARLIPADSIIISISQGPQDRIVNRDKELQVDERGLLKTDANGETTMPGIFASGDVVTGAKTVVEAVKYSKMIADAMDEYVKTHYE